MHTPVHRISYYIFSNKCALLLMARDVDPYGSYSSPLTSRYASTEMKYNFSPRKKFSTWRRLWLFLAKAEKVSTFTVQSKQSSRLYNIGFRASDY